MAFAHTQPLEPLSRVTWRPATSHPVRVRIPMEEKEGNVIKRSRIAAIMVITAGVAALGRRRVRIDGGTVQYVGSAEGLHGR
jgi:hypothetical protein